MRPKKKILLVDGDELRRSVAAFVVETNGYIVLQAGSAREAAEALSELGDVDLVVAAGRLPDTSGVALLDWARSHGRGSPGLLLGSWEEIHELQRSPYPWLYFESGTTQQLELIKLLCARKRGPVKGSKRPAAGKAAEETEMEAVTA